MGRGPALRFQCRARPKIQISGRYSLALFNANTTADADAAQCCSSAGLMAVAAGERLLLSSRLFGLPTPSVLAMLSFGFPHLPFFDKKKRKEFSHRRPPTAPSCDHIGPAASSCSFLPNPGGRWPRCHLSDYQLYFHSPRECLLPPPLPLLPRQE